MCLALGGCAVFKTVGGFLTGDGSGETMKSVGAAVATVNPLIGGILTVLGIGLTAVGEIKKTSEGR